MLLPVLGLLFEVLEVVFQAFENALVFGLVGALGADLLVEVDFFAVPLAVEDVALGLVILLLLVQLFVQGMGVVAVGGEVSMGGGDGLGVLKAVDEFGFLGGKGV